MIMAKVEEGSSAAAAAADDIFVQDEESDDLYIDLDTFWKQMGEPSPQESLEESSLMNLLEELEDSKEALSLRADEPRSCVLSPSYNSEASDCRTGCSDGFSESAGNSDAAAGERLESSWHPSFSEPSCSEIASCIPDHGNGFYSVQAGSPPFHQPKLNHQEGLFGFSRVDTCTDNLYNEMTIRPTDPRAPIVRVEDPSLMNGDKAFQDASHFETSSYDVNGADILDLLSENGGGQYLLNSSVLPLLSHGLDFMSFTNEGGQMFDMKDDGKNHIEEFDTTSYEHLVGNDVGHHNTKCRNGSTFFGNNQVGAADMCAMKDESITSTDIVFRANEVIGDVMSKKYHQGIGEPPTTDGLSWSSFNSSSLGPYKNHIPQVIDTKEDIFVESNRTPFSLGMIDEKPVKTSRFVSHDQRSVRGVSGQQPSLRPMPLIKSESNSLKIEKEVPKFNGYGLPGVQKKPFEQSNIDDDDDDDVCILEDMSKPASHDRTAMNAKLVPFSQFSSPRLPTGQMVTGHSRLRPNDERIIFRVALQDLSQPKSEATPPDGVMAVPLLKHQRIALFWMVNKETKSACCSGGILADDQGLGKTVSTIALILKERPCSKAIKTIEEQVKTETLDLDEDDDEASETYHLKKEVDSYPVNDAHIDGGRTCLKTKGRPAAGTLIVCPTSVLRQWSDELHNKVTREANLSVLVYHGSNRTKDPLELAKYDVVVTTYAIVSMEVPKQPYVDENDDSVISNHQGFSSCKKRKQHGMSSVKKCSTSKKSKNAIHNELLENISGPLAKVGWFRVVLDEAQSIKNHRTQVARACWGLRAKRRWCLSGTPIQNAIDDLYSYFRFLRHEPYAVFGTFREQIKAPIQRNPKNGYKKLQAVLKTIMLRRTKATLLDGEPIINLPPKTIELKQVDFSKEEREFYRRLEADSQAQFAEYAAQGTVKQNYVNILLMLLRLRQACDHPLLVKGSDFNSNLTSSILVAKKLPRERQVFLVNCLEASLAICGICSDPPEDAVVTICGHVFCNQCICEHMLGDDPQCPTKNCKTHLNTSSVFSMASLRNALSNQLTLENTPSCSDPNPAIDSDPPSVSHPDSSKIRAALEILMSLSKPRDCDSKTSPVESIKGSYGSEKLQLCESRGENVTSDMNRHSRNGFKVAGEKAIVFSQWTRMLDMLEASLKNTSIQYRRLDGTMPVTVRDKAVKDFNSLPQVTVMIMSLKAASLGLNMVAACRVILLDLWWNPTTEDQAIDRAHRIGQTRPVSVFRLTVKDTVEDRILALQQRKREMVSSAFGEDETGARQTRLTVDDLHYLFRCD